MQQAAAAGEQSKLVAEHAAEVSELRAEAALALDRLRSDLSSEHTTMLRQADQRSEERHCAAQARLTVLTCDQRAVTGRRR